MSEALKALTPQGRVNWDTIFGKGALPVNPDTTTPTCKNCTYSDVAYKTGGRVGCTHPKVFGKYGEDDDGATEDYAARLDFGPDFGCIHFTGK